MDTVIRASQISKTYGTGETAVKAVQAVTLEVRRSEIILLMGPSGSGKTTLMTIIGGLLRPSQGTVLIGRQDIWNLNQSKLSQFRLNTIGFIFQDFNLLEDLTVLENIAIVMNLKGRKDADVKQKSEKLLADLGLGERLNHLPGNLSGGEKQRVAIARAIINEPDVILADEPTANLDSKTGHQIMDILHELAKSTNKSLIIASHDWRIRDIADRTLWMEDGQIVDKNINLSA